MMAPTAKPNDGLLARVNFPLYSVQMLTSRHVLVAGGGGSSKTGIANGFEIYEVYHNGDKFVAEEVLRHETGSNVVMNCAIKNDGRRSLLVAGQESHCQLYIVNIKVIHDGDNGTVHQKNDETAVRNRRSSMAQNQSRSGNKSDMNSNSKQIRFEIKSGDSIQTDFSKLEPIQRVVRLSGNGKLMATGGTDGYLRLWTFPRMTKLLEIEAHAKELDDLDFSPDNRRIVSIAKDGMGLIWDVETGKQLLKLTWNTPENLKYSFKRCRFSVSETKKGNGRLFTISNPIGKVGKQKGYLQHWDPETGELRNAIGIDESLASLAVRDDGRFVAVGTMFSGSVSIYISFSLQRVLHVVGAHSMFVTGLEFLPINNTDGPAISSNSEAAVVSISVDNKICIHNLQYRHTMPSWLAILFIIVVLFITFMLCSYLGL